MTRQRREDGAIEAMCDRLVEALDDVYALSDAEMARYWGYMNSSSLTHIRKRRGLPDVLRLAKLVKEPPQSGGNEVLNLNWLIAGTGPRLIEPDDEAKAAVSRQAAAPRVKPRKVKS